MPLLVVGIALIVLGVVLLFIKEGTAVSKGFGIEVNGPIGIVVLVAGTVCIGAYTWLTVETRGADGPKQSEARPGVSSSSALPTVTEPSYIKAESIQNGEGVTIGTAVVRGKADLELGGTALDLGGDSLWMFDYDPNDELHYRDSDKALSVKGGQWSFVDGPIGDDDSSDKGTTYRVVVVRANQGCSAKLAATKPNEDGDVVFSGLPVGCTEAAWVNVLKTGP